MLEAVDNGVGKILKTLDEHNLSENTLVILTSDNGGYSYGRNFSNISNNGVYRGQKTQVYEGVHRVPFIARWPERIKAGWVSDKVVMTMDLYPTFCRIAGIDQIPVELDGIDLTSHLLDNTELPERSLYWKIGNNKAIRNAKWKLCWLNDSIELYDLENDPGESMNLVDRFPDISKKLQEDYLQWEKKLPLVIKRHN